MSRCYPYTLRGYEKKENVVELGLSPKKEKKHKRKEEKKKRRKDSGDLPRDLDKRSKQARVIKGLSLVNGSVSETQAILADVIHQNGEQRLQVSPLNAEVLSAGHQTLINKEEPQLSLVPVQAACDSNGAVAHDTVPSAGSSSLSNVNLRSEYIRPMEKAWSEFDDQEWLFQHNNLAQSMSPRSKSDEKSSLQVWADAVLLPSVGIYALPYVVPD